MTIFLDASNSNVAEPFCPQTKFRLPHAVKTALALSVMAASLAGCVVYPDGGYYGGGGYAPAYYAPPPVSFDFGYGGGYYGHHWR